MGILALLVALLAALAAVFVAIGYAHSNDRLRERLEHSDNAHRSLAACNDMLRGDAKTLRLAVEDACARANRCEQERDAALRQLVAVSAAWAAMEQRADPPRAVFTL